MTRRLALAISIITALVHWRYTWGGCWSPLETSCFTGNLSRLNDFTSHYDAWIAYLRSDWLVPAYIDGTTWPTRTSAGYGDTMPIFAITLKAASRILGIQQEFQYFSIASIANSILTCSAIYYLGCQKRLKGLTVLLASLICITTPVLGLRTPIHEGLAFQSVVIWSCCLGFMRCRNLKAWCLILGISAGVHPYLGAISSCGYIGVGCQTIAEGQTIQKKVIETIRFAGRSALVVAIVGFVFFASGYGIGTSDINVSNQIWDMNLLAPIDPQGTSSMFSGLNIDTPYEWEGYSYLGLGLTGLGTIIAVENMGTTRRATNFGLDKNLRWHWITALAFAVYAIGPNVHIGSTHAISLESIYSTLGLKHLYGTFRSCGRFSWPLYYSLVICFVDYFAESHGRRKNLAITASVLFAVELSIPSMKELNQHFAMREADGARIEYKEERVALALSESGLFDSEIISRVPGIPTPHLETISSYSLPRILTRLGIRHNLTAFLARYPEGWHEFLDEKPLSFFQRPEVVKAIDESRIKFVVQRGHTSRLPVEFSSRSGEEYRLGSLGYSGELGIATYEKSNSK